jgi:hypothetical protein
MRQSKVIFSVQSILDQWIDMINVELAFVEEEINEIITDETPTSLAFMESALQLFSLFSVQP